MIQPQRYSVDGAQSAEDEAEILRVAILHAMGSTLAMKRREAVNAKTASGIENVWIGDEEHYQGYDDANRHEFANLTSKPSEGGTAYEDNREERAAGSTVFPNITQPYVDAAAARVGDMLLPTDDRNFAINATPIPDMLEGLEAHLAKVQPPPAAAPTAQPDAVPQSADMGMPQVPGAPMPVAGQEQAAPQGQPQQAAPEPEPQVQMPDGAVMALSQAKLRFDKMKAEAARKAGKAQDQIDDWLVECQYHAELRKVIDDSAKLGAGVIKGPVPVLRKSRQWRRNERGAYELIIIEEIKPASFRVDPWDLFPDPACGESIHNGAYIFERDRLTGKKLEELIGVPGYLESQIRMCLKEGPQRAAEADGRQMLNDVYRKKEQYEIWYFHGNITREELEAAGCDCSDADPAMDAFPAMMTMVNDRVIRASMNPLDSGDFPYDVIPWKYRPGMPWGMGVARQMRTPQRIVVAATRNLMDNAGLAAGPQIVLRRGVSPENGVMEIVPLKLWLEEDDAGTGAASSPVTSVVIPMLQEELMAIVQFGMKMAEDVTGLPMLLQGQQGTSPDTVGGMQILNNNANSVLRRIARLFDSCITEPHIRRYYAWLMDYSEDDDAKGDFQIEARGSSALVERDIQSQELVQIVQMCLNPAFGKNPKKAMDEYLKSRRFDPAAFEYSEEEQKKMDSQPAPEDPRITAAKIMVQGRGTDLDKKLSADQQALQIDAAEREKDRQMEVAMAQLNDQLEDRRLSGDKEMSLEDIKAMLATTAMKLRVQKELSALSTGADLHKHNNPAPVITPPTEPAGRAPAGMAYQA